MCAGVLARSTMMSRSRAGRLRVRGGAGVMDIDTHRWPQSAPCALGRWYEYDLRGVITSGGSVCAGVLVLTCIQSFGHLGRLRVRGGTG